MSNLGAGELLIVLAIVLLIFGGAKLPQLARSMGQASKEFKAGLKEGGKEQASVEGPCPFCNTEVPKDAKFCPGCARDAADIRAERARQAPKSA